METITVAEIGRKPSAALSAREPSIVTNNGRPQNLIVNVEGMDIDDIVDMARSMQAKAALATMRRTARKNGILDMPMEEVDAEVAAVRSQE